MKKTAALIATLITPLFLLPLFLAATLVTQSCGNGESVGNGTGSSSGGSTGSGSGSGGSSTSNNSGSGGALISLGSGGSNVNQGSGGASTSGSGGSSTTGSGGATTGSASGGSTVIVGSGSGGSTIVTGGGGSTGTPGGGMDSSFSTDGYGMNTAWMGYLFTGKWGTATIAPLTPAMMFPTGKQICASGSVPADALGGAGALIGWSLNQAKTSMTPGTWMPTGFAGISVTLSTAVTGARVQIEDATQKMTWCATMTGATAKIPWSMFNTTCWDTSNPASAAYSGTTPLRDIEIEVPSSAVATNFNFCWIDAAPY